MGLSSLSLGVFGSSAAFFHDVFRGLSEEVCRSLLYEKHVFLSLSISLSFSVSDVFVCLFVCFIRKLSEGKLEQLWNGVDLLSGVLLERDVPGDVPGSRCLFFVFVVLFVCCFLHPFLSFFFLSDV